MTTIIIAYQKGCAPRIFDWGEGVNKKERELA
jgi:hypothetical protein